MNGRPLSIVHFSTTDVIGGSARSAYRIHSGLRAAGHGSRMLVGIKAGDDPDVAAIGGGLIGRFADRLANKACDILGLQYQFVPSSLKVPGHPWVRDADVIQLYNTHGGYFSQSLVARLAGIAPVVWRLSDLWPMTGHCAYPGACERWRGGCGECPDLASYPAIGSDRTAYLFNRKDKIYRCSALNIVAPSSWTEKCARESPLLGRFPVTCIPNGLDAAAFRPIDRAEARQIIGIDPAKKVIMFAAHILDDNPRKGGDVLLDAVGRLENPERYLLILVGEGGRDWARRTSLEVRLMGFVGKPDELAEIYSAADVVAIPSAVENLPNVLIEALACGRAIVASDTGGMNDGIRHMETGYLARPGDATDLADGLRLVLNDETLKNAMEAASRRLFEERFTGEKEISHLLRLYRIVIADFKAARVQFGRS
jgi:glycosyltransferase involved in cell wall biosynthesis